MKVDSINWKILDCLQKNARQSNTDISKKVGITSPAVAERIRKTVAEFTYLYNGKIIPVTISMGTATFDQKETLDNFQTRADKALYKAKGEGRNVVISSELKQTITSLANYQIG